MITLQTPPDTVYIRKKTKQKLVNTCVCRNNAAVIFCKFPVARGVSLMHKRSLNNTGYRE